MVKIRIDVIGETHDVPDAENIGDLLRKFSPDSVSEYAIVFLGKKLSADKRLCDIPDLNGSRLVRLVRIKEAIPTALAIERDIRTLLVNIKKSLRRIADSPPEQAYQYLYKLMTYTSNNPNNLKKILREYPQLVTDENMLPFDSIVDFRILNDMIHNREDILFQYPHCLVIFKKVLDSILSISGDIQNIPNKQPHNIRPPVSAQNNQSSVPLVTQDMLQQALASALGSASNIQFPSTSSNSSLCASNYMEVGETENHGIEYYKKMYGIQLEQMTEFGFSDELENIEALRVSDGNVEMALQIVLEGRERSF